MDKRNSEKLNIVIITGLGIKMPKETKVACEAILENLANTFKVLAARLYIITGDFAYQLDKSICVVRIKGDEKNEPLFISGVKFVLAQLKVCYHLIRISKRIDVAIFHFGASPFALPVLCCKLLGIRIVSCATSTISKEKISKVQEYGRLLYYAASGLERIYFGLADQVAVESPIGVETMGLERYRKKIAVNGMRYIDEGFIRNKDICDRKNLVGFIGRLSERKRVANFAQAMPLIREKCDDIEFFIGGDGPIASRIHEIVQNEGLSGIVKFSGSIPHNEMPEYLNELKLFVLPSDSEGLPGAVQEAMACGAVVVSTPVGCVPDLIRDGETGFIMEDNSPECIARNVIRALNHPEPDKIAENARRLIEQEYHYEAVVEKCRSALERVMEGKRGHTRD